MTFKLTPEHISTFRKDGVVLLKGVFDEEWLKVARRGIEKTMESPSQYSESIKASDGAGIFFNDYLNWKRIAELGDLALKSPAAELAGRLTESAYVSFYHEHVLTREGNTPSGTPWHHDQAYYPVDGDKNVSLWIPIDPVPQHTAGEFVAESHTWGWFRPLYFKSKTPYIIEQEDKEHDFQPCPDVSGDRAAFKIRCWDVQPGDCVAFHMKTLHGAPSNSEPCPRRIVSLRYLGDDCVLARRPWKTSPPITGGLNIGDPMVSDEFPIAWRNEA